MKSWHISSSNEGYFFNAVDYSFWRHAVEESHGWICWATRGWLGGHGMPEIFFKLPLGKSVWSNDEEDPYLENSIAMKLYDAEQAVCNWAYRKESTRFRAPISDAMAEELDPRLVKTIKEIHGDD